MISRIKRFHERRRRQRVITAKLDELYKALDANSTGEAVSLIEEMITQYHYYEPAKKVLFVKKYRPQSISHRIELLERLASSPALLPTHRVYAKISVGYQALALGDKGFAEKVIKALQEAVGELAESSNILRCQLPNKENQLQQFISINVCLVHLHLLCGNFSEITTIASDCHSLLRSLCFDDLPADVVYRTTSNFARVICLQGTTEFVRQDLALLCGEARRVRHEESRAPEDHRTYLEKLQKTLVVGSAERVAETILRGGSRAFLVTQLTDYFGYLESRVRDP